MWGFARRFENNKYEKALNQNEIDSCIDRSDTQSFLELEKQDLLYSFPTFTNEQKESNQNINKQYYINGSEPVLRIPFENATFKELPRKECQIPQKKPQKIEEKPVEEPKIEIQPEEKPEIKEVEPVEKEISEPKEKEPVPKVEVDVPTKIEEKEQKADSEEIVDEFPSFDFKEVETKEEEKIDEEDYEKRREFELDYIANNFFKPNVKSFKKNVSVYDTIKKSTFPDNLLTTKLITDDVETTNKIDTSLYIIEKILGRNNPVGSGKDSHKSIKFYVKFVDVAYIHCQFLTIEEIKQREGGEKALKKFLQAENLHPLMRSLCIPNLLVLDNSEIDPMWFNLERVLDESNDDNKLEYLAKWRGLDYEQTTWESADSLSSDNQIEDYKKRMTTTNSRRIPSRWKRPNAALFKNVKEPDNSLTGLELTGGMLKTVNTLIRKYYERNNVIFSSSVPNTQCAQIVAALDYLTNKAGFNGPILLITEDENMHMWKDHFSEWTGFNAVIYEGNDAARKSIEETEFNVIDNNGRNILTKIQADVIITSFDLYTDNEKVFSDLQWRVLIVDATNVDRMNHQFVYKIESEYIIVAAKKITTNNVSDIWSFLHLVDPKKFNEVSAFKHKYSTLDISEKPELVILLNKYIIFADEQYSKENYHIIEVEPSSEQIKMATDLITLNNDLISNRSQTNDGAVRYLLQILRLISDHPVLYKYNEASFDDLNQESGKFSFLEKVFTTRSWVRKKWLIFSELPDTLVLIHKYLNKIGVEHMMAFSTESDNEFEQKLNDFDENDEVRVFLYSSKYGARKIDTSIFTSVILFDIDTFDFTAAPACYVYHLVTRGFPDELLIKNNLCYDNSIQNYSSLHGPYPISSEFLEIIVMHAHYVLNSIRKSDREDFIAKLFEDTIRKCGREGITSRRVDPSFQYSKFVTTVKNVLRVQDIVPSVCDIGLRNRVSATQVARHSLHRMQKSKEIKKILNATVNRAVIIGQKYASDIDPYLDQCAEQFNNAISLFCRLQRALEGVTNEVDFPKSDNIYRDYELLYYTFSAGIKETLNLSDKGKITAKVTSKEELIGKVMSIIEQIERRYKHVDNNYPDFLPLPPENWKKFYRIIKKCRDKAHKEYDAFTKSKLIEAEIINCEEEEEESSSEESAYKYKHPSEQQEVPETAEKEKEIKTENKNKEKKRKSRDFALALHIYIDIINFGIPTEKPELEKWYSSIIASNPSADAEKVNEIVNELVDISVRVNAKRSEIAIITNKNLKCLGEKFTEEMSNAMLDMMRKMSSINECAKLLRSENKKFVITYSKESKEILPKWWKPEYSRNLIVAINKFGNQSLFTWIVKPMFGFNTLVPEGAFLEFEAASKAEKAGKLNENNLPKKLGVFKDLLDRDFRTELAYRLSIDGINTIYIKRKYFAPVPKQNFIIDVSNNLKVVGIGHVPDNNNFFGQFCPFPVGYVCMRSFKGKDKVQRWYKCTISSQINGPLFHVELAEGKEQGLSWYGLTASDVWSSVAQHWKEKGRTRISGMWLYGLANPKLLKIFKMMCKSKKWKDLPEQSIKKAEDDSKFIFPDETV